jgi:ribosome-associated protein
MTEQDQETDQDFVVSKSQRKREMLALQELGQTLITMDAVKLQKCLLPEDLLAAINEYKRLPNKHEARRRQLQYIGKLMRQIDTSTIEQVIAQDQQQANHEKRLFQHLEFTLEALLEGSEDALQALIQEHPDLDIQYLRQLIRQAIKEKDASKPPQASRKLFKYLRDLKSSD